MIICTGISKVQASTYLGEFCWGFVYSDSSLSIPPFTAKLAVTDMGNQHFIVNGIDTDNFLYHGNAEIIGSDVHLSLYSSFFGSFDGFPPEPTFIAYHVVLSLTSLSGTFYDEFSTSSIGTVKFISFVP